MKPILLYLVVVEMVTTNKQERLYQDIFQRMQVNSSALHMMENRRLSTGNSAQENQFPFMVLLLAEVNDMSLSCCSSALIDRLWTIVSGHCIDYVGVRPENIILAGGKAGLTQYLLDRLNSPMHRIIRDITYGVQERRAKSFYFHPRRAVNFVNDFALIKLAKEFTLATIRVVNLPVEDLTQPTQCFILGWGINSGNTTDGKLKYIKASRINTTRLGCRFRKTGNFLCHSSADGGGLCQGDSGSPLVCNDIIYGIASHVVGVVKEPMCGENSEEYYSELLPVLSWVENTILNYGGPSNLLGSKFILSLALTMVYLACIS